MKTENDRKDEEERKGCWSSILLVTTVLGVAIVIGNQDYIGAKIGMSIWKLAAILYIAFIVIYHLFRKIRGGHDE